MPKVCAHKVQPLIGTNPSPGHLLQWASSFLLSAFSLNSKCRGEAGKLAVARRRICSYNQESISTHLHIAHAHDVS